MPAARLTLRTLRARARAARRATLAAGVETKITDISGSVEAAVGLGLADAVVDLVETGTTMRAAGLCVAENLMQTQVHAPAPLVRPPLPPRAHASAIARAARPLRGAHARRLEHARRTHAHALCRTPPPLRSCRARAAPCAA